MAWKFGNYSMSHFHFLPRVWKCERGGEGVKKCIEGSTRWRGAGKQLEIWRRQLHLSHLSQAIQLAPNLPFYLHWVGVASDTPATRKYRNTRHNLQ